MQFAGVSWHADGYEIQVVTEEGKQVGKPTAFALTQIDGLINRLHSLGPDTVTVIDSSIGTIDGRMMAAGLTVYRADPPVLAPRPLFGSVAALDLARLAQKNLTGLTRLERHRGTQTGREKPLAETIARSAQSTAALIREGRCLEAGPRDRLEVALTFDDGPLPLYTNRVLDTLGRYAIPATFFCVGLNSRSYTEEIARIQESGHLLGNHTWSHPFLQELSEPQLQAQIDRTSEALIAAGGKPTGLFRPPYGSRTPQVMNWLGEGTSTVVLWDVAPDDWAMPGTGEIARRTLDQAKPGSIILLHDGGGDRTQTVDSLPEIIEGLLARDYRFVTVDDMLRPVA
jgi:peptidoglycan/xylan/chitin deacetylase (PgdA/CDA1 family)